MTFELSGESPKSAADRIARSTARIYDGIVEWYVDAFFDDLSDVDWLDRWIALLPPRGVVADIGAGPGNFAKYIASNGFRVVSSDISPEMAKASMALTPEAAAAVADMRNLPFRDNSFNGVVCAYSLMHVPAPANRDVLGEFARVLCPGGYLQLMLKTVSEPYSFRSARVADHTGVMQPWGSDDLRTELKIRGLRVVDSDERPSSSPHEFDHPKVMVIARLGA